jgi:hypothetical protein
VEQGITSQVSSFKCFKRASNHASGEDQNMSLREPEGGRSMQSPNGSTAGISRCKANALYAWGQPAAEQM